MLLARPFRRDKNIQRAMCPRIVLAEHMRINLSRLYIVVPKQLLYGADVRT
jgi:hypothetical protein